MTKRLLVQDDAVSPQQSFALPADAGAGLPAEWTVDEFGNVIIAPSAESVVNNLGTVHIVAPAGAQDAFSITDSTNPTNFNFAIDQFGYIAGAAGSGADFEAFTADSYTILKVVGDASAGQVHDLLQVKNDTANRLVRVIRTGYLVLANANAAPADADIPTSGVSFWLDDTPGSTKLMVKAKDSNGAVRSGSVNLS